MASKVALEGMTGKWAQEFSSRGITVNTLAPGIIHTRIHEHGTYLLPVDDEGNYITGEVIEVGAGMLAA